jgi:hypothetical protein
MFPSGRQTGHSAAGYDRRDSATQGEDMSTAELTARELAIRFYLAFDAGDIEAVLSVLGGS